MKIGTALTTGATRVMLLGSGELGKELAIALQRYGVEIIAVDRYANAPAQQVAQRAHVIDMTDVAEIRKLVELEQPQLIVPEIEAIATEALLEIERSDLAEVIPTARAVEFTMNRENIRRLAAEQLALPTSPYAFANSPEELRLAAETIGYPCFIKSITSSSGKGQSLVQCSEELQAAWNYAREGGRVQSNRVIVEGKVDFDFEITLLTVRYCNGAGEIETRYCEPIGHRQEKGDYVESWQPQFMSTAALHQAQRIAGAVTEVLGGRGVFGVELFVNGDQVWFSEVSPRPHDTGMVTMITQAQCEFELHARAVLGLPICTAQRNVGASAVIYGGIESENPVYEGVEIALQVPETAIRLFGKLTALPRRRMGVALAAGSSIEEARDRARQAAARIRPLAAST